MRCLVQMFGILHREVEVFREAVGLEVALLQAGAALEHPARADHRVGRDAGQEPAEGVVLFHHVGLKLQLGCEGQDFLLGDHEAGSRSSLSGTQTRHAVTRRSAGSAGSRRA